MAEVTACWAKWPASCSAGNPGASGAFRLTGSKGGCPKLSERVDRIEQIILEAGTVRVAVWPAGQWCGRPPTSAR